MGPYSYKFKSKIETFMMKYFKPIKINFIFVNKHTIGSYFQFKDVLPKYMRSNVIYSFCCEHCSSEYVGSTSRLLKTRIAEHAGLSSRTGQPLLRPPISSIRNHSEQCNTNIDIDNFEIVSSSDSVTDLRIIESLHILLRKPPLNDLQSAFPLQMAPRW